MQNAREIHSHIRYLILILFECKEYAYIKEALKDFQEDPVACVYYLYAKYKDYIMENGRMDILRLHNDTDNYFEKVQSFLVYYEEYQQSKVIMNDEELMIMYSILSGRY